ncbi:MAG: hypothetical protein ACKOYM_05765, partial [Actinomycetes bacterium]
VIAIIAGWVYVLFVYQPERQIDELSDRRFPIAAQRICAAAMVTVDALPAASTARTPEERGVVVAAADDTLRRMVNDLRGVAPAGRSDEARGTREWIDDWGQHVKDRAAYANSLRRGEDARFLESTKGTRQLSRAIDAFAQVNRMPACSTPNDVG